MARTKYLLDTNICAFLLRGKYGVTQHIDLVGLSACAISEITVAELKYGQILGQLKGGPKYRDQHLDDFFRNIEICPIAQAFDLYAEEKARLQLAGTPADDFDLLIGCTSVVGRMTMVTENIKDFKNINGIKMENWIER
ncbi:MAG: type II toxin-antitoxin system VapC family toxin [Prevotella sp.]|nr:type II toxin-antitoxin system VapC family toxin [Prevotella sp.]